MLEKINGDLVKGVRIGLTAFFICFAAALLVSAVINYGFINEINMILNGSLSDSPVPTFGSMLLISSVIMNLSVFNSGGLVENGGHMHFGLLILIVLPFIAFFVSERRLNKEKHFDWNDFVEYLTAGFTFSVVLFFFSLIVKGMLLNISINFTHPFNLIMTTIILLGVQIVIGINYNKKFVDGIHSTKVVLDLMLAACFTISVIGLVVVMAKYVGFSLWLLLGGILLIPNIAVYMMFMFMGASIELSDQLQTLFEQVGIDPTITLLPTPVRGALLLVFLSVVFAVIIKMKKEDFIKNILYFSLSLSLILIVLAYVTTMNLGFIKNMLNVQFGINYGIAFIVPFVIVVFSGSIVWLFRRLKEEIHKEIH